MSIFKAYDIRGLVPEELDAALARRIGSAFVRLLSAKRVGPGGTDRRQCRVRRSGRS